MLISGGSNMLISSRRRYSRQHGTSLVEVLVTLVILAFGLLGVAGLQGKMSLAEMESYQRSQALMALTEMTERLSANAAQVAGYLGQGTLGTGNTAQPAVCTGLTGAARDLCEWNKSLQGASEQKSATNVGGMVGAVGCITQIQASNPALGVCTAGIYQVSVAWQGMSPTAATPALACGAGTFGANEAYRRVIAAAVTVGTTSCY
jgi:type IV pilus assembly protein PilV